MTDKPPEPNSGQSVSNAIPGWKDFGAFLRNILLMERTSDALKAENKDVQDRVRALRRQLDDQGGKLTVLTEFVGKALDERVEARAEEVTSRKFEALSARLEKKARRSRKSV